MASNLKKDVEIEYDSIQKVDKTCMRDTLYRGAFWPTALCLGVMCILQATLNITLRLNFNLEAETDLLNTSFYNLTIDELRTSCTDLLKEKNQLHLDRDQLQIRNINLGKERDEIKASNKNLVKERDEIKKKKDTLQHTFPKIVALIRLGWIYFHSSLYYISTEKKSWGTSRLECKKNDADLVIINSKEEEDFIIKLLGNKSQAWVGLKMITGMEWNWVDKTTLSSGYWSKELLNNGNNEPDGGNTTTAVNRIAKSCTHEEWWVCEKNVFQ